MRIYLFLLYIFIVGSCSSQNSSSLNEKKYLPVISHQLENTEAQIGDYVTGVFEDSKGNLWFSTLTKGVAKYDGKNLTYDTTIGYRVGSIVEDSNANLWFGTHSGVYKYDGKTFTNYSVNDGLCDNLVSNIIIDRAGNIWVGTWGGVCKFDGSRFINFPIPTPDIEIPPYQETMNWLSEIMEDSNGNIWFGRDGYGATKYNPSASLRTDGESFTHFTKKDGLASNSISDIQEDKLGNIWFSSRITEKDHPDANKRIGPGGVVKYDGKDFIDFPGLDGLNNSDVFQIYRDSQNNIWIGTTNNGVYKYNPSASLKTGRSNFTNYKGEGNVFTKSVMSILEDSRGTIWLGCAGGLFRLDSDVIINVTTNGPWE